MTEKESCPTCGSEYPPGDLCPNAPHDQDVSSNKETDMVNHPDHYNAGKIEVIEAIDDWNLGFSLGNAVKYIARAEHKGKKLEDLKKAQWYLNHEIERIEKQ